MGERSGTPCRLAALLVAVVLVALTASAALAAASASAAPLPADSLGVNTSGLVGDLAAASAAGAGVARESFVVINSGTDAAFELTAAAHLRLYAALGLPRSTGPSADATAMAAFVTSFAQRYGPGGSFWVAHPELPNLPVQSYEIGNEPNTPPTRPGDGSWLRYGSPAGYAEVYEAARTALHTVDPSGTAVLGGMLDSGALPLSTVESYLSALTPGAVDAVGFHPYLGDETLMEQDTTAVRAWLNAHGFAGVPLDINEFGAFPVVLTSASWGALAADYTQWSLCTPSLGVENVQPFWWGGDASADSNPWFPLISSELAPTPYGTAFLNEAQQLTTHGCPGPPTPPTPPPLTPPGKSKTPAKTTKPATKSKTPAKTTTASKSKTPAKTTKPASKSKTPAKTTKRARNSKMSAKTRKTGKRLSTPK